MTEGINLGAHIYLTSK